MAVGARGIRFWAVGGGLKRKSKSEAPLPPICKGGKCKGRARAPDQPSTDIGTYNTYTHTYTYTYTKTTVA